MLLNRLSGDLYKLFAANIWVNFVFIMTFLALGLILSNVEFGAFRVAQAYIAIATTIAMLGLNTAVTHLFPRLSMGERKTTLPAIVIFAALSSLTAGVVLYYIVPTTSTDIGFFKQALYAISFPLIVAGAVICNIALAIFQANGELAKFSKFQIVWKSSLFFSAMVGAVFLDAHSVLIAMAFIYPIFLLLSKFRLRLADLALDRNSLSQLGKRFYKSAIWPFASACISIIYANIEFLNIDEADLSSGLAGAYSLASLIFIGGAAFFLPFQTYAGSRVVNKQITVSGLFRLQAICLFAVIAVAGASYAISHLLFYLNPVKFNSHFLDFAFLVCLKLTIWGSYAVIGSVLNFVNKGFEAFIITVIVLSSVITAFVVLDLTTLRDIVVVQIFSSVFILFGSVYLVVAGFRDVVKA